MGGKTGGGINISEHLARKMEARIKNQLGEAAQPQRRNIFISFQNEDRGEVELLRGQAKNENSALEFNDWSLRKPFNSERAEYIRQGIRQRIQQSSVTVVYVGQSTHKSQWVDWEIRESLKLGKGIVAVHKGESSPRTLPAAISEHNIRVVSWRPVKGFVDAVNRAAEGRSE